MMTACIAADVSCLTRVEAASSIHARRILILAPSPMSVHRRTACFVLANAGRRPGRRQRHWPGRAPDAAAAAPARAAACAPAVAAYPHCCSSTCGRRAQRSARRGFRSSRPACFDDLIKGARRHAQCWAAAIVLASPSHLGQLVGGHQVGQDAGGKLPQALAGALQRLVLARICSLALPCMSLRASVIYGTSSATPHTHDESRPQRIRDAKRSPGPLSASVEGVHSQAS